jgi:hypothetical protein
MSTLQHPFLNGIGINNLTQSLPSQHIESSKWTKKKIKENLDRLEQIGINQLHRNMEFNSYYLMLKGEMIYSDYGLPDLTKEIISLRNESGLPTTHRHYDFLGIIVNQIRGEYSKLKDTYRVDTIDQISQNDFLRDKKDALMKFTMESFDNYLQRKLVEKGVPIKEQFQSEEEQQEYLQMLEQEKAKIIPPEEIERKMAKDWKTIAAEWATATLEYDHLRTDFNMEEIEDEEIVDYILTGRFFRHYHVGYDYYKPEKWDVRTTFFSQDVDTRYPQNGEYVGRINYLAPSDIINRYGSKISDDIQKRLSGLYSNGTETNTSSRGNFSLYNGLKQNFGETHHIPFEGWYDYDLTLQMQEAFQTPFGETIIQEDGVEKKVPAWFSPINRGNNYNTYHYAQELRNDIDVRTDLLQVTEAYWRSFKRIGLLNYTTPDGMPDTALVTDDLLPKFLEENEIKTLRKVSLEQAERDPQPNTIVYTWIPVVRWGVKIAAGNSYLMEDLYIGGEPTEYQIKGGSSNVFDIQLPVAGYVGDSLAKKLRPFIIKHNIVLNQVYNLLEKELGTFLIFDMHFLPSEYKNNKSTRESLEMLYEAVREIGIAPVDTSKQNMQGGSGMNTFMSQSLDFTNQIASRMQLAQQFKMMALEQIGITPQRIGQSSDYMTATGVKEGMTATYNQTDPIFAVMANATRKATELHLAIAQYCQKNYKDFSFFYVKDDGSKSFVSLSDDDFPLRNFGVFPINSAKSKRELENLKQILLNTNTQGSDLLDFAMIVSSTSVNELIEIGRNNRLEMEKAEQQKQQHEQELVDKQIQAQAEQQQADREWEEASKEKDRETKIYVAELTAEGRLGGVDANLEYAKIVNETSEKAINNTFKQNELGLKEKTTSIKEAESQAKIEMQAEELKLRLEELKLKRERMNADKFIATINKN